MAAHLESAVFLHPLVELLERRPVPLDREVRDLPRSDAEEEHHRADVPEPRRRVRLLRPNDLDLDLQLERDGA